jgi:hypothetical protein
MKESKYIVDIIGQIVESIRGTYDPPAGLPNGSPFYLYGHPLEVINTLSEWTKNPTKKFQKFPLIILFTDIEESKGLHQGINSEVKLEVIICTATKPEYKSTERTEITFKPVLYPLYDLFIAELANSGYFMESNDLVPHTMTPRYYWGKSGLYGNTANMFNDYIDAIEIKNLQLTILNHYK